MSKEFVVYPSRLKSDAQNFTDMYLVVTGTDLVLKEVQNSLKNDTALAHATATLNKIIEDNRDSKKVIIKLRDALLDAVKEYNNAEKTIISGKTEISNPDKSKGGGDGSGKNPTQDGDDSGRSSTHRNNNTTHGGGGRGRGRFDDEEDDDEGFWEYIGSGLWQALAGDFEEDSNALGIALNVIIGFVPYAGQVADVRDLVANVIQLVDDGPTTSEWVDLLFTTVGLVPGVGDVLKHADELGPVFKRLDKISDGLGETVKGIMKNGDEVFSAIEEPIKRLKKVFDDNVVSKITKNIDEFLQEVPSFNKVVKKTDEFFSKKINIFEDTIGDVAKEAVKQYTKCKEHVSEWVSDVVDDIKENGINPGFLGVGAVALDGFKSMVAA